MGHNRTVSGSEQPLPALPNGPEDEVLPVIVAVEADLTRDVSRAQESLAEASRALRFWSNLREAVSAGHTVTALLECRRALKSTGLLEGERLRWVAEYAATLESTVQNGIGELPRALPEALSQRGLELDASARHPTYAMRNGFIRIEVDAKQLVGTVRTRGNKPTRVPLDVERLAEQAVDADRRLFRRRARSVTRAKLVDAYARVLSRKRLPDGHEIALEDLRKALGTARQQVPLDEFIVDLGRTLVEAAAAGTPKISLSNIRDTDRGVLLYGMEQAGYVGYLRVDRSTSES
jgi:hypothetical protein